jgi:ubiquinone/menaquinone biosynthesis C-methylase UbiE
VSDFWDDGAVSYDRVARISRAHREKIAEVAEIVLASGSKRVLDLGCGSGVLEERLLAMDFRGTVEALDASERMLRLARKHVVSPEVRFRRHDLNVPLPFDDATCGCVAVINVIFWLQDQAAFLAEARRSLRVGGTLVLVNPKQKGDVLSFFREHLRKVSVTNAVHELVGGARILPDIAKVAQAQRELDRMHAWGVIHYATAGELRSMLKEAGFTIERMSEVQAGQNWLVVARRGCSAA